jgi:hypothetical protein
MKSNRNRVFLKNDNSHEEKSWLNIIPILPNIIFVAILITAYWYISTHYLFADYINIIYWVVNVLVTYNLIAASARSILAPLLGFAAALLTEVYGKKYGVDILSQAEFWQLVVTSAIGVIIAFILKL